MASGNIEEAKRRIEAAKASNATKLSLFGLDLTEIPTEISLLTNLATLDLEDNQLTQFPTEISLLTNLKALSLRNNQLTQLPTEISLLTNLKTLSLSNNQLTQLPTEISLLTNLTTLSLSYNQLTQLPTEISLLTNLTTLSLSYNQLTQLPTEISLLTNLTELYLDGNQLTQFPTEISLLTNLTTLDLHNNQLTQLPTEISLLTNLTTLDLHNNQLTQLPTEISLLTNLTYLDLSNNQLTQFPTEISLLTNLTTLDFSYNQLTQLPTEISLLTNLKKLYLNNNQLTQLPTEISLLTNLLRLNLSNNQLTQLPTEISLLTNLTHLALRNNQLTQLPTEISLLTNLTRVDLRNNQLTSLPLEILKLRHLAIQFEDTFIYQGINLYGNEETLTHPPVGIIKQGWDAIENYFEQLDKKGRDALHEAKLVFIGEGRAGKTSLMRALMGEPFDASESSTEGIAINHIMLPKAETGFDKDFRLNLWDFGGQEIYKDTHRFFLTKDTIYILVVENRKNIGYDDIYYWLNGLNVFAPNAPVLLVQNKCEANIEDLPFQQYKKDFANIAPDSNLLRTSCTQGHEDTIAKLRQAIIDVLKDETLAPQVGDDIPATWVEIRQDLIQLLKDGKVSIPYHDFVQLCLNNYGLNSDDVKILAGYFFRMGIFVHYADNPLLRDTIFLDNQWLTNAVYKVVDNDIVKEKKGRFSFADLETMYKDTVYQGKEAVCIELMEEFKICYEVERNKRYICPQRLSADKTVVEGRRGTASQPEAFSPLEWHDADTLHFAFDYDKFMPRGIMSDFIVAMHKGGYRCDDDTLWRHGMVIHYQDSHALIHEDPPNKRIHIYIQGARKQIFLDRIREAFNTIHKEMNNLQPEAKLACRCEECAENPQKAYFFDAKTIFRRWYKNKETAACGNSDIDVPLATLMGELVERPPSNSKELFSLLQNFAMPTVFIDKIIENKGMLNNIEDSDIGGNLNIKGNRVR